VFVVAQMSHETNTFSPVVTDLARFAGGLPGSGLVPPSGQTVIRRHRGQRTGLGAFIELAETAAGGRGEVVASIDASAPPSGVVQDHAYDYICDAICTTVRETQPDAIFLCLHGAMVCESYDDGEGGILVPIATG
jgi:microcystin degradation protein MlrC